MVFVLPRYALRTNRCLVRLAKLLQELLVIFAEVTGDEGAWIGQHVRCLRLIPQMRFQVNFTVRLPADEAGLDRC